MSNIAPLSLPKLPRTVRLLEEPGGKLSSQYPITVGKVYEVRGRMGCCIVTTCDVPDETVSLHHERFAVVSQ